MIVRPMRAADLAAVGNLAACDLPPGDSPSAEPPAVDTPIGDLPAADAPVFGQPGSGSDQRSSSGSDETSGRSAGPSTAVRRRAELLAHLFEQEPDGCWVADVDDTVIGFAQAGSGEKFWTLSHLVVASEHRHTGVGTALLDAALASSQGCLYGAAAAAGASGARLLRTAGFSLYPTLRAHGTVEAANVPVIDGVRVGTPADRDLADSVDRQIRGATHGAHHELLARTYPMFVCDLLTGSGYCYLEESGSPVVLAATNRKIAQRLLWSALAAGPAGSLARIAHLSSAQEWAIDVAMAAGLRLEQGGYLALRYIRPPTPYLPAIGLF